MTHVAPLLSLVLLSSLLSCTAAETSILCIWTKVLPNAEVHYSFLRSDPRQASPSLRLYHSAWSGERALLSCAWNDDAAVIQNYVSACRERTQEFSDHPDENIDVESMFSTEELCVSVASRGVGERRERTGKRRVGEHTEVRTHQRVKRSFIVPGTLWCGSGNNAPSYADLGVFADTDSCCREHDHCKDTILSFHSQFGLFNKDFFTMCHCDCDKKFHSCLTQANDSISDMVGYTFFNLLKRSCFEFSHRLQCTERNWFGMCKKSEMALSAVVHAPMVYDSPDPTEVSVTSSAVNTTGPTEMLGTSNLTAAAASTLPPPSSSSRSASVTTSTSERLTGSAPEGGDNLMNTLPAEKQTLSGLDITEEQLSCAVYKDLDGCRYEIRPQQTKYGLYNPEAKTLYHCNCTSRVFQTMAEQRQFTKVQTILLGRVSQSCFLLRDCTAGKICTADLVRAELPQEDQRSRADTEEQRHLQAVTLKVRQTNVRRAKRKDGTVRLHKLCLRVVRARLNQNRTRAQGQDARGSAVRGRKIS